MAATTARRTRKQQSSAEGQEQQAERQPEGIDMATGEVKQPEPQVNVEPVPVTYYRPSVTMPDGKVIVCGHKYLHENEKAAAACGRKIAARGEFVK